MPAQTTNLFLIQDLEGSSRTTKLADSDLNALHTVAEWIKTFVAKPNKELGRAGPVCPFVPVACEHKTLWLAPEQVASQSVPDVVRLITVYKRLLLRAHPTEGDDANYKAIVVVFTDLSVERAKDYADDVQLQDLQRLSYVQDGVVLGEFHEGNAGSAIHNVSFQPFKAPVPFLLMRLAVISDWMFFWTTKTGSAFGGVASESPRSTLLLRKYVAPTGGSTNRDAAGGHLSIDQSIGGANA